MFKFQRTQLQVIAINPKLNQLRPKSNHNHPTIKQMYLGFDDLYFSLADFDTDLVHVFVFKLILFGVKWFWDINHIFDFDK